MKAYVQYLTKDTNGDVADALGSDGVFILDGRNKLRTWRIDADKRLHKLRNVQPGYIGYKIMKGDLRDSVEVYRRIRSGAID
jgi:hypothetical protein